MSKATVKNWDTFQHYKDRSPPWLKLHRQLLDNMEYAMLSPEAGKALPLIWLIASDFDGALPQTPQLAFRLRCDEQKAGAILAELVAGGFLTFGAAEPAEQRATPAQLAGWGKRHISDAVKREVWARDGGKCVCCQSIQNIEYDHVTPVSLGGSSESSNIQLLCRTCNRRKRASVATPAQPLRSLEGEVEVEAKTEKKKASPKGDSTFSGWVKSLNGAKAIPADHAVFTYAEKVGIPAELLTLAWGWFEKTYGPGGTRAKKRYSDWPGVFRNAVEGNWAKAWYADADGGYRLSTVGLQLQREAAP